ncbi:hypothetical protein DS830_04840 [Bombilactobacillus bombi]|uniref:hypothetical protein n=1 Tax=Bombilactobacillus bombi TaxID=1303590 RepID=UPI000E568245|nr:hypothetical protein [Bombilactobacillus bombi]AXX64838.1 hypothetical protein DS830_04840 [Bombilactobacillus bombi]
MYYTEIISNYHIFFFGFVTGLLIFLLARTLNLLFNEKNNKLIKWGIISCILMYPFDILSSAGWIATIATYFWPFALTVVSLIPLIKSLKNQKTSMIQNILCSLSLVYAANNEQIAVILIIIYTSFLIILKITHRLNKLIILQYIFILISIIFILTTPGIIARSNAEVKNWFPSFIALNNISKFQLGYTSTLYTAVFHPNCLIIAIVSILFIINNNNNRSNLIRIICTIPLAIIIAFNPIFTNIIYISKSITYPKLIYGLVTTYNYTDISIFLEYLVLSLFLITLVLSIYFSFNTIEDRILSLTLLIGGVMSRIAMGFSPTIWISNLRTYSPLFGCIFLILIMLIKKLFFNDYCGKQQKINIITIFIIFGCFNTLSLFIQVIN